MAVAPPKGVNYLWSGSPRLITGSERKLAAGEVKLAYLTRHIPPVGENFAGFYAVSSTSNWSWDLEFPLAKIRGVKIVWNQNGLYYPAWGAAHWRLLNARLTYLISFADGIVYQSQFCRRAAEQLLPLARLATGKPTIELLNPVDIDHFTPAVTPPGERPVVLTVMSNGQIRRYQNILALEAMKHVWQTHPAVRISFIGTRPGPERDLVESIFNSYQPHAGVPTDALSFVGNYTRQEAPEIFRQGTSWLHTTYCDACPNIVAEAMAVGLPVTYLNNGGTPEVVGSGGIGIPCPEDFMTMRLPRPQELARAIICTLQEHESLGQRARFEACSRLSVESYVRETRSFLERLDIL